MFWRKKKITDDLKAVAEVAGEQIAPGAGTLLLALGAVAVVGAAAYVVRQRRKNKSEQRRPQGESMSSGHAKAANAASLGERPSAD